MVLAFALSALITCAPDASPAPAAVPVLASAPQPVVSPSQLKRKPETDPATMDAEEREKRAKKADQFLSWFALRVGILVAAMVAVIFLGRWRSRRKAAKAELAEAPAG